MVIGKEPTEWTEAAEQVVRHHWKRAAYDAAPLEAYSREVIEMWYDDGDWDRLAQAAMISLHKRDLFDVVGTAQFLAGKQHDYGPRNILKFGVDGLAVRLWDKIARFSNLRQRGTDAKNEPLVDTFIDMVGYVVIRDMLRYGWFELPINPDRLER